MFDIGTNSEVSWVARQAFDLGWPGLVIGIAIGLAAWHERKVLGTALGGFCGLSVWAAVTSAFF